MASTERELVVNYALQNDRNLEVALKIASAFDEIKKKIIIDFLEALEDALKKSLDGEWKTDNHIKQNVFEHYKELYIAKEKWKDNYSIGIESEKHGARGFIIGVGKKKDTPPIDGGKLWNLINEKYKPGYQSSNWEWWQSVEGIYENWDHEEVLIKMYKKDEAVKYFKEHILRIRDIAEPIIDEAVKSI